MFMFHTHLCHFERMRSQTVTVTLSRDALKGSHQTDVNRIELSINEVSRDWALIWSSWVLWTASTQRNERKTVEHWTTCTTAYNRPSQTDYNTHLTCQHVSKESMTVDVHTLLGLFNKSTSVELQQPNIMPKKCFCSTNFTYSVKSWKSSIFGVTQLHPNLKFSIVQIQSLVNSRLYFTGGQNCLQMPPLFVNSVWHIPVPPHVPFMCFVPCCFSLEYAA